MLVKLTTEAVKNNSFSAEDVFDPQFLKTLKNESLFWMKEFYSIYYGTCFTICSLEKVPARNTVGLNFTNVLPAAFTLVDPESV